MPQRHLYGSNLAIKIKICLIYLFVDFGMKGLLAIGGNFVRISWLSAANAWRAQIARLKARE